MNYFILFTQIGEYIPKMFCGRRKNTKKMALDSRKRDVYRYGNPRWWMFQIYISFLKDSQRQPRKNIKTNNRWSNNPRNLIKAWFICVAGLCIKLLLFPRIKWVEGKSQMSQITHRCCLLVMNLGGLYCS